MKRRSLATILCVGLMAGVIASAPVTAAPIPSAFDIVVEEHIVKTRHGHIYVEVARPVKGERQVKGPVILTYSPYSALGRDRSGYRERYVPKGYVVAFADLVGTGNSGGCYDYGGKREQQSAHDLVQWFGKQKWSTGKVAMMGGSYEGTTATAAAITAPKNLTTIIPEAAISRWYGYAYSGGVRWAFNNERPADEGIDTPLLFDFGFAVPPPVDAYNANWTDRVASSVTPCDEIAHTERGYDDTPDYDGFWKERDYIRSAKKINVPVLVAHNWGDWNVKPDQAFDLFKALRKRSRSPKVSLFMGHRYAGHSTPGGNYQKVKDAWLDHYLMGKNNGINRLPAVTSQQSDYDGATGWKRGGAPKTKNVKLMAQLGVKASPTDWEWKLLPSKPIKGFLTGEALFPSTNANAEAHANHHARNNHDWRWFESPPLKEDVRIFGEVKVKVYSQIARKWVTVTAGVVDINPDCHEMLPGNNHNVKPECMPRATQSTTRGFIDTRYRNGLGKAKEMNASKPFSATIVTKPQDYTFKKGHQIGLNISTEVVDWMVPKPHSISTCEGIGTLEPTTCSHFEVLWEEGRTQVLLPVVGAPKKARDLFKFGPHAHH